MLVSCLIYIYNPIVLVFDCIFVHHSLIDWEVFGQIKFILLIKNVGHVLDYIITLN